MLRNSCNGGGDNSLALFGSTKHEGLVNSANQFVVMDGSGIGIRRMLTVGDPEFQLQLAEASRRVDPGSSQGT